MQNKTLIITGIIAAALLACVLGFYGYYNGLNTERVDQETTLSASYQSNQLELDTYVKTIKEAVGIANVKSDKIDQILRDAVSGRYGDSRQNLDGSVPVKNGQGGSFISAIVEAYPDIGLAAALFAKAGAKVVSVKPTPDSERRAKKLCNKNEITGVEYLCGSVGEILPALTPRGKTALLISSSKQEGNFGQAVLKFSPDIILYLSSDISRLTDDLLPLCDNGYSVVSATPYDSTPYSCNVETLVCLAKTIK